jgi:hypothetical protein
MTTTITKKPKTVKVPKPIPEHRDKLGRKLELGSMVAYAHGNGLHIGKIIKLNPKMIGVQRVSNEKWGRGQANIYPTDMVLLEGSDVTFYILKNSA